MLASERRTRIRDLRCDRPRRRERRPATIDGGRRATPQAMRGSRRLGLESVRFAWAPSSGVPGVFWRRAAGPQHAFVDRDVSFGDTFGSMTERGTSADDGSGPKTRYHLLATDGGI